MESPIPTLERTSAEIRDRAVAENHELRQTNAELREALRDWLTFAEEHYSEFDLEECHAETLCPKCRPAGCINLKIRTTRALLGKAKP